jgi:hypothetical protein
MYKGARTKKMQDKYQRYKKTHFRDGQCSLCNKSRTATIKNFKHWRIVKNLFPWDRIARIHHMIIPKRHVVYEELSALEKRELDRLRPRYLNDHYWVIAEATHRKKSIPGHFHLHLMVLK